MSSSRFVHFPHIKNEGIATNWGMSTSPSMFPRIQFRFFLMNEQFIVTKLIGSISI